MVLILPPTEEVVKTAEFLGEKFFLTFRDSFESGAVVKLVITPACHAGGRGFESRPLRQQKALESQGSRAFLRLAALRSPSGRSEAESSLAQLIRVRLYPSTPRNGCLDATF